MMPSENVLWLELILKSDTTFGRGDGVAGVVDDEVQHDDTGLPYLGGRTLKGLLAAECAEILFGVEQISSADAVSQWHDAGRFLFGEAGSGAAERAHMHVGNALLPADLRNTLANAIEIKQWSREQALDAVTALRRQTAMDMETGAPKRNSLRAMRVVVRETPFVARLDFDGDISTYARGLLAACVKALQRAGTGRHRGRGRVRVDLYAAEPYRSAPTQPLTDEWFALFEQEVVDARV